MDETKIVTAVLMDEHTTMSLVEVCQTCHISEESILEMIEHGLLNHQETTLKNIEFDLNMLSRIKTACRLQQDLGINLPGIVLVLDLLDELAETREELRMLQRHVMRE